MTRLWIRGPYECAAPGEWQCSRLLRVQISSRDRAYGILLAAEPHPSPQQPTRDPKPPPDCLRALLARCAILARSLCAVAVCRLCYAPSTAATPGNLKPLLCCPSRLGSLLAAVAFGPPSRCSLFGVAARHRGPFSQALPCETAPLGPTGTFKASFFFRGPCWLCYRPTVFLASYVWLFGLPY